jgi:hypothetical protein
MSDMDYASPHIRQETALQNAMGVNLPGGQSIRNISAPFVLDIKMEAFRGRGQMARGR